MATVLADQTYHNQDKYQKKHNNSTLTAKLTLVEFPAVSDTSAWK